MHEQASLALSHPSPDELLEHVRELPEYGDVTHLARFTEGAHNIVWKGWRSYELPGGQLIDEPTTPPDFVLRHPKHPAHDYQLRKEVRGLALVGNQAPKTFLCTRLGNMTISLQEFIPGQPKEFNELNEDEITNLALVLSDVHAITDEHFSGRSGEEPNCCGGTYEDYVWAMVHESVNVRRGKIKPERLSIYSEALTLLDTGTALLSSQLDAQPELFRKRGQLFSLQHHDCNQDNVLWLPDGTCKLIDWNPTFGDPADELAYVFTDNHCSDKFIKTFLSAYRPPEGSGDVLARVPVYILKNMLDDMAWTIEMRELHPGEKKYLEAYHERVINVTSYLQQQFSAGSITVS